MIMKTFQEIQNEIYEETSKPPKEFQCPQHKSTL